MAGELQHAHDTTGVTLYAVIRNVTGQVWNTTGTPAFETQININWVNGEYDIVMAEAVAGDYFYLGNLPAVDMGKITVSIHLKAGGVFSPGNPIVGSFAQFMWSGTVASSPDANVTFVDGDVVSLVTEIEADVIKINGEVVSLATEFDSNLVSIFDTALTETAGQLAGGFKKFFDVGSPTGTLLSLPDVVAGANGGLLIAGSNAATTFATLTVSGATSLQALGMTTFTASGAMSAASLTLSGTFQAATIVSTGTTTLNALTVTGAISAATLSTSGAVTFNSLIVSTTTALSGAVTLGAALTVTGTTTLAAITQTGIVSLGATTLASMAVTGALTSGSADFTTVLPVNATQINGSALAAQVLAAKNYEYKDDAVVLVADGADDTERGTNLATAYTAAKSLTPGGNALSASNRAAVLIPPGRYYRSVKLSLDTNYVDLFTIVAATGSAYHLMLQCSVEIYGDTAETIVEQTATDVRVRGIASSAAQGAYSYAWYINTTSDYSACTYEDCLFRSDFLYGVKHSRHVCGLWNNCQFTLQSLRCGDNGVFSATVLNCNFPDDSVGGDATGAQFSNAYIAHCIFGDNCIGGCSLFGIPMDSGTRIVDVECGDRCISLGKQCAGTLIRVVGGTNCGGATVTDSYPGEFAGYAEDCYCKAGSFGGRRSDVTGAYGKLTGTLDHCTCEDSVLPWRVEGATINDCLLTVGTNDQDCITLLDSNSRINQSTLLVVEGGTGVPINAASALNVSAIDNCYNNKGAAATGLGTNVTNVGTGESWAAIIDNNLDHLALTATASANMTNELADNTILSRMLANGDTSAFVPSTDGLQPIRDRGDAAWVTATDVNVTQINGALTDGSPVIGSRPRLYLQQLRAECNIAGEGALHCTNASNSGVGQKNDSFIGQQNSSVSGVGQYNVSVSGEAGLKISGFDTDILLAGTGAIKDGSGNIVIERDVANVMDDAIPGSPTADSINERLKALDDDWNDGGRLDLLLDDIPNTTEFEARTILAAEYFVVTDYTAPDNTSIAAILDDTGTSGVLLSNAEDVYHADVFLTRDTTNKRDEYTVHWYLNGTPITSGITVPTIQVVKRSDGTDLISTMALTQIGTTGAYKLDTTTRLASGEAALAVVVATMDGSSRTWRRTVGRDI